MQDLLINIMSKYGYIGVFFLILVENIFPPIPSEVILLVAGFMTHSSNLSVPLLILTSSFSSLFGGFLLYYLGRMLNKERIEKIVKSKIGKMLHLKINDINKSINWFNKRGSISVFFGRCIPIIRSLISIPAGISKMNITTFTIYTFCGSLIWNTILISLGKIFQSNWIVITKYLKIYKEYVIIILIIGLVIYIFKKNLKKD